MSLTRLQEIIAKEWARSFKEDFSSEKALLPLREKVETAADLLRLLPATHRHYQDIHLLLEIGLRAKVASSLDALVDYLLSKYKSCLEGELAPTLVCYHFHQLSQFIVNCLTAAIQEKLLSPELNERINLVLKEQQKKQENKTSFAYVDKSYKLPLKDKVLEIIQVAYSSDVGLFFRPPLRPEAAPLISEPQVLPSSVPQSSKEKAPSLGSSSLEKQAKKPDPKMELKRMTERFKGQAVFSSERAYSRARKAFVQGEREPSLVEKLIRYSVWKERTTKEAQNPRLIAAKEMAEQVLNAGYELRR